jgi:outer membrane protein OmpA-like peptidoglycan-associated protein
MTSRVQLFAVCRTLAVLPLLIGCLHAQSTFKKEVDVVNYLENKKSHVKFLATSSFATALGAAEIEVNDRHMATIKAGFKNLQSVFDLGGRYSTYVLWMVGDDGSARPLGELETDAKQKQSDSEFRTEVPISGSFGLLVTAEPYGLVRLPSRTVALVASSPLGSNAGSSASRKVECLLSDNDYSGDRDQLKKKDEQKYRRQIPKVLGAQYAILVAREADAETLAAAEMNEANSQYQRLQDMLGGSKEKLIEQQALSVIGLAAAAEKKANETKKNRREKQIRDRSESQLNETAEDLRTTRQRLDSVATELARLKERNERLQRDFFEKDAQSKQLNIDNDRFRSENDKLRDENLTLKMQVGNIETELDRIRGRGIFAAELPALTAALANFGKVQQRDGGLNLTLPDEYWGQSDPASVSDNSVDKIEAFAREVAGRRYLSVQILSYVTDVDDPVAAQKLADSRADSIANYLTRSGVLRTRISVKGFFSPPGRPVKGARATAARVEILLKPLN